MLLFLLVACEEPVTKEEIADQPKPIETGEGGLVVEVLPSSLDFGIVGAPAAQTLQVFNNGSEALSITGAQATDATLAATFDAATPILPGSSGEVVVSWTPPGPGEVSDALALLVASASGGLAEAMVPVTGTAAWPVIDLAVDAADLGTVNVGCTGTAAATITNAGTTDLVIDTVALTEGVEFALGGLDEAGVLPWTLAPGASQSFTLLYTPSNELSASDLVVVTSNDPLVPVAELNVVGAGNIEEQNSISYTVIERQAATVLFALNQVVPKQSFKARFEAGLPIFFDSLLETGAHFRVGFIHLQSGVITGSVPYIDDSMTSAEATDIAIEMVSEATGDNDYLLQTLSSGIEQNRSWLLDESDTWLYSRLSLVGMNSDTEQSPGNSTQYVTEYLTYKNDPADVLVDAIAGDFPRGCSGAEPSEQLWLATDATGGTFLSICEADWTTHMQTLAAAVTGDLQQFSLTGDPAEWSIEVYLDGILTTTGWTYNATELRVEFEDDLYPTVGTEVRIDYLMTTECVDAN